MTVAEWQPSPGGTDLQKELEKLHKQHPDLGHLYRKFVEDHSRYQESIGQKRPDQGLAFRSLAFGATDD